MANRNQQKYSPEFKMKVVQEAQALSKPRDKVQLAEKYGISISALRVWTKLYEEYGGIAFDKKEKEELEKRRIEDLEKQIAELKEENEILKKAAAFLAEVGRK